MIVDSSIVVVKDLLQVLSHEDKVDTAEAKLCDTKEGVYNNPGIWSESSQSLIAVGGEACLSNIGIGEEGKTCPPAELL